MEMFISFFTGKVMLFYGISLIMKEKSNASALGSRGADKSYDKIFNKYDYPNIARLTSIPPIKNAPLYSLLPSLNEALSDKL